MESSSQFSSEFLMNNYNGAAKWLEDQSSDVQFEVALQGCDILLNEASKPDAVAGKASTRLCGFIDQCSKSQSSVLRDWAYSQQVAQKLFNFYIDRSETHQDRSLKLTLDFIVQLLKRNPDREVAASIQREFLQKLTSIITGSSAAPVAKPAIKILDQLISKKVLTLGDLKDVYRDQRSKPELVDDLSVWSSFFAKLLSWVRIHHVSQPAGRLVVLLYRQLRKQELVEHKPLDIEVFYRWLRDFLGGDVILLEAIKNSIFVPLFNNDRADALEFLRTVHTSVVDSMRSNLRMDMSGLLWLAALESGKRVGLVEEPEFDAGKASGEGQQPIVLEHQLLKSVLSHPLQEVRSLAFSLLVTSSSTTKPYSLPALALLRKHIGAYFADPDAKFRVDVMAKAKDMYQRVRGSIRVLKRSIPRAKAKERQKGDAEVRKGGARQATYHTNVIFLPVSQLEKSLQDHVQFLRWYIEFLCKELVPTASYQRHVASLKALTFILRAESESSKNCETSDDETDLFFDLFDSTWVRALFDLIMDRFDDVRSMAAACLTALKKDARYRKFTLHDSMGTHISSSPVPSSSDGDLRVLLDRCVELGRRTARFDHSDGTAKASQLIYRFSNDASERLDFLSKSLALLEHKLEIAEKDLGRAVLDAPVHGDFAALRYIWQIVSDIDFSSEELKTIHGFQIRIANSCQRIWDIVKHVLCDDSPEGHLPQELEDMEGLNTKDVLSYSFRAIDESSNLLKSLILTIRNRSRNGAVYPPFQLFEKIGNLSFEQLSTLRHRGAFTTVTNTFACCCQQARYFDQVQIATGEDVLSVWYKGTMDAIFAQQMTTRRSAGIPALITGILSSNASEPSFEGVMERLIEIAGTEALSYHADGSSLPQVHAYNCIKDIFRNSLLTSMGKKSNRYLARCLELAANGLRSEAWAIRNCGLILLRSLIDSLFGTQDSKTAIEAGWDGTADRIAYGRYATLPQALVNLLKAGHDVMAPTSTDTASAEAVFPALDIIRRAGPPDVFHDELQSLIIRYLASPVWHVREMAARTLCSCLLGQAWLEVISDLLQDALRIQGEISFNYVHGILTTLKFVLERLSEVAPERILSDITSLAHLLGSQNVVENFYHCSEILSTYLEVVNRVSAIGIQHSLSVDLTTPSIPQGHGGALLRIHQTRHKIYEAYRSEDFAKQLHNVFLENSIAADTMADALQLLPELWKPASTPNAHLSQLAGLYVELCLKVDANEPRAMALQNLAEIMDQLLGKKQFSLLEPLRLLELWATLPSASMNPSLFNAIVRVSGCIIPTLAHFQQVPPSGLRQWGHMVALAGLENEAFDTRYSAAEALRSFTSAIRSCATDEYLPSLLALYDALNDDDDEVREVAAAATGLMSEYPVVPIEASTVLLEWLTANFSSSPVFKDIVIYRLTGAAPSAAESPWEPADARIDASLVFDDSLFIVEDQNLFIDGVREVKRWCSVYSALSWDASDSAHARLDEWLQKGLTRVQSLLELEDGPLGWASDPKVFAITSTVLLSSAAVVAHGKASVELREMLRSVRRTYNSGQGRHVSGLLMEPLKELRIDRLQTT